MIWAKTGGWTLNRPSYPGAPQIHTGLKSAALSLSLGLPFAVERANLGGMVPDWEGQGDTCHISQSRQLDPESCCCSGPGTEWKVLKTEREAAP